MRISDERAHQKPHIYLYCARVNSEERTYTNIQALAWRICRPSRSNLLKPKPPHYRCFAPKSSGRCQSKRAAYSQTRATPNWEWSCISQNPNREIEASEPISDQHHSKIRYALRSSFSSRCALNSGEEKKTVKSDSVSKRAFPTTYSSISSFSRPPRLSISRLHRRFVHPRMRIRTMCGKLLTCWLLIRMPIFRQAANYSIYLSLFYINTDVYTFQQPWYYILSVPQDISISTFRWNSSAAAYTYVYTIHDRTIQLEVL